MPIENVFSPSKDKEIVAAVCEFFTRKGYLCKTNFPLFSGKLRLIADVFCKKDKEKNIIEVKTSSVLTERDLQRLITNSRYGTGIKWYLCIPYFAMVSDSFRHKLAANNIGLLVYEDGRIKMESPSVSFEEFTNQLEEKLNNQLSGYMPDTHMRVSPLELDETRALLNALKFRADAILQTTTPVRLKVSSELLDQIGQLSNIRYAEELSTFEKKYRNANADNEYQIILETLKSLWKKYEKERGALALKAYKEFEPLLKDMPGYRDHMVHPFQVFLMGSIIIDRFYEKFQTAYKTRLQNSEYGDMDFAWMLCSTFHDFCYPIQMYELVNEQLFKKFLQVKGTYMRPRLQTERILLQKRQLKFLDQLTSLFCHCLSEQSNQTWTFDSECKIDDEFRSMLLKEITDKKNHAPLSALTLLNMIYGEKVAYATPDYIQKTFSTAIFPASLAIALHDTDILMSLPLNQSLFFKTMPIAFLLVYCDTAQEFGRSNKDYCTLKSLSFSSNLIETDLVFSKKSFYNKKSEEVAFIMGKLKHDDIVFKLRLSFEQEEYSKSSAPTT